MKRAQRLFLKNKNSTSLRYRIYEKRQAFEKTSFPSKLKLQPRRNSSRTHTHAHTVHLEQKNEPLHPPDNNTPAGALTCKRERERGSRRMTSLSSQQTHNLRCSLLLLFFFLFANSSRREGEKARESCRRSAGGCWLGWPG